MNNPNLMTTRFLNTQLIELVKVDLNQIFFVTRPYTQASQNQLHQRCECTTPDSQVCRNYCDADTTCVGYAQGGYGSTCDFYQTSGTCPSQCSLKSVGVVGPIDSYPGMDYFGCHVVRLTPVTENPTIYFNGGGGGFGMPSYSPTWSPVFPLSNSPTERPTIARARAGCRVSVSGSVVRRHSHALERIGKQKRV